jgi:predicted amidohydrolase YtcJ
MKAVQAALEYAAELGVTSVQDMSPAADFHLYQALLREGKLTCRILAVMPIETHTELLAKSGIEVHFGDAMLRIGSLKAFSDGSMGAGSALFFDAYSDDPSTSGLGIYSIEKLQSLVSGAHSKRLQIMTHAIGDKANRWVLDAYEAAIEQYGQFGLRHRIEHAQVVTPEDLPRFAHLGVIASIQPSHVIDDMRWAEKRIGKERCKNAYRCRSFFEAGAHVAFGTDWPVEDLNPMLGLYAATTREYPEGGPKGGWFPEEKIPVELAVRSYTWSPAYAEFEEQSKGTLETGKLADLIVLDRDLFSVAPKDILKTKVDMTVVGGKVVFERE